MAAMTSDHFTMSVPFQRVDAELPIQGMAAAVGWLLGEVR
jgi:hypothetical protein